MAGDAGRRSPGSAAPSRAAFAPATAGHRLIRWLAGLCLLASGLAGASSSHAPALEKATRNVELVTHEEHGRLLLQLRNLRPVAIEVEISSREAPKQPAEYRVLPPKGIVTLFEFEARTREEALAEIRERYRLRSFMGDPTRMRPDLDHRYRLPFAAGRRYRLSQGFHGEQSHTGEASRYALDFQLEIGDPVHAARAGTVVRAVDWFSERVDDRSRIDEVNLIVVEHDDGTLAHYVHLDHDSVRVAEGDKIERGQYIADVGLTGFTRGPHLHFVVCRERDISIPVRFEGYDGTDLSKPGSFRLPRD